MTLNLNEVVGYVEDFIGEFHSRRLQSLEKLKLNEVLKRKNPYLFKAKNATSGADFVKTILDAHLSSQEETIFGEFLEGLAIFVCGKVYNGRKSSAEGIDLEFRNDEKMYIASIKSGPNWGNSRQISKMRDDFKRAKRVLGTSGGIREVIAVNGCCYGKDNNPNKGDYYKLCGQEFWEFISGNENLYIEIIEPLGYHARERNDEFTSAYWRIVNTFILEFGNNFYTPDNEIDWQKLIQFNSGKKA